MIAGRSQPAFCARSESSETGVLKFGEKSGGRSSGFAGGALDCALPLRTIVGLRIGVETGFAAGDFLFFAAAASRLAADGVGGFNFPIAATRERVFVFLLLSFAFGLFPVVFGSDGVERGCVPAAERQGRAELPRPRQGHLCGSSGRSVPPLRPRDAAR